MSEITRTNDEIMQEAEAGRNSYRINHKRRNDYAEHSERSIKRYKEAKAAFSEAPYPYRDDSDEISKPEQEIARAGEALLSDLGNLAIAEKYVGSSIESAKRHLDEHNDVYHVEARKMAEADGVRINVEQPDEFVQPVQVPVDYKIGPKA